MKDDVVIKLLLSSSCRALGALLEKAYSFTSMWFVALAGRKLPWLINDMLPVRRLQSYNAKSINR
jgi:hypothetical protein